MVFLAIYNENELGLFPETRIYKALSIPAVKKLNIVRLPLRTIPARKRYQVIRENIDKTDFIIMGVGTYTFMESWAHFAAIYGFSKNRPMLAGNTTGLATGWEIEMTMGPSPFSRVEWRIQGDDIQVSSLDTFLEITWKPKKTIPKNSVHYRFEGNVGLMDEIAPMYRWHPETVNQNLLKWIEKSIWLAGL